MRLCLLCNPTAGTADRIKDFLLHLGGGTRCEFRATSVDCGAQQIAREAVEEGFDRIIVAGGDGTVSQVVNGIAPNFDAVELAILPFGTGNDLARALGVDADNVEGACRVALEGRVRTIDLLQIRHADTVSYCTNVANGGIGGHVAVDIDSSDKKRWGPLAYWMSSVSRLVELDDYHLQMKLDDSRCVDFEAYGLALANGRFVGGGFPIAPRARLDDGLMDLTIVPVLPRLELMAAGFNFTLGRDQCEHRVRCYTARKVEFEADLAMPFSIDGEVSRSLSATFEIVPSVLRVAVGEEPVGFKSVTELNTNLF